MPLLLHANVSGTTFQDVGMMSKAPCNGPKPRPFGAWLKCLGKWIRFLLGPT